MTPKGAKLTGQGLLRHAEGFVELLPGNMGLFRRGDKEFCFRNKFDCGVMRCVNADISA